jgi:hypothetical protein
MVRAQAKAAGNRQRGDRYGRDEGKKDRLSSILPGKILDNNKGERQESEVSYRTMRGVIELMTR